MGVILSFERGRDATRRRAVEDAAADVIAAFGAKAGLRVRGFAEAPGVSAETRRNLLTIAEEIERRQGYGWLSAEDAARL